MNNYWQIFNSFWGKKVRAIKRQSSPLLLTLSGLFLITALIGLIWMAQEVSEQSFDNRQQASVANGSVTITSPVANGGSIPLPTPNAQNQRLITIPIEMRALGSAVVGVNVKFNIITNGVVQTPVILENPGNANNSGLLGYDIAVGAELLSTTDGYFGNIFLLSGKSIDTPITNLVNYSLVWGNNPSPRVVPQHSTELFYIQLDATKNGQFQINFDEGDSMAIGAANTPDQGLDILTHVQPMNFTVGEIVPTATTVPPTETPAPSPQTTITTIPNPTATSVPPTATTAPTVIPSATPSTVVPTTTGAVTPTVTGAITPINTSAPTSQPTVTTAPTVTQSPTSAPTTTTQPTAGVTQTQINKTDDFSILLLEDKHRTFTFYLPNTNTQIRPEEMESGKQYRVVHTVYVQNTNKEAANDSTRIPVSFLIKNVEVLPGSIARSDIAKNASGGTITFDSTFIANVENQFEISIDKNNTYPETNENNNAWTSITFRTKDYSSGTGGVVVTYKQCNEGCGSNTQCAPGFRCFDTGTEKKCRLSVNVSSETCLNASTNVAGKACNGSCANASDCKSGFTCWYNQCRQANNVESNTCALLSSSQQTIAAQNCNQACTGNKDCAANFRCYNGACRLASNPGSNACSTATPAVATNIYPGKGGVTTTTRTTPAPTSRVATGSGTTRVSPTPRVSVTTGASVSSGSDNTNSDDTTPDSTDTVATAQDTLTIARNRINGWLSGMFGTGQDTSLLIWVLLAGIGLFLIALLFFVLRLGRSSHNVYRPPVQAMKSVDAQKSMAADKSKMYHAQMDATSASTVTPVRQVQPITSMPPSVVKTAPFPQASATTQAAPVAGTQPVATTDQRQPSSMLDRIKDKHIQPPQT